MNRAPALPIKASSWSLVHLGSRTRTAALLNQEQIRAGFDRKYFAGFPYKPLGASNSDCTRLICRLRKSVSPTAERYGNSAAENPTGPLGSSTFPSGLTLAGGRSLARKYSRIPETALNNVSRRRLPAQWRGVARRGMVPCLFGRRTIRGDHFHFLHCECRLSAG